MAVEVGVVYATVLPDMSKFGAALQSQASAAATTFGSSFSSSLTKVGSGLSRVGKSLTKWVTLPLVGAGVVATHMALDFEDAFVKIDALVGASDRQLATYKDSVMALAGETAQAPADLANALYFVTSSGFSGAAALKVLEASAKASTAGLGDVATVADAVTSAVNAFGKSELSAAEATDVLVGTVREGKGEASELSQAIGRVIPLSAELGVSFQDTGAALASMTLSGLDAAEATTALRGIFTSLLKPSADGEEQLKKLGLSAEALRRGIDEDGLLNTLIMLKERLGDNKEAIADVFPNVRALAGFLNLTGRNADKNVGIFAELNKNLDDTGKAFETASESAGFKFRQALVELQKAAIRLGNVLIPVIVDKVIPAIEKAVKWFSKLSPEAVELGLKLAGLALVAGPILRLSGGLLRLVGALTSFSGIAGTAGVAAARLHPILLAIAAAVGVGVIAWQDWNRRAQESAKNIAAISDMARQNMTVVKKIAPAYAILATTLAKTFGDLGFRLLSDFVQGVVNVRVETHKLVGELLEGIPAQQGWNEVIEEGRNLSQKQMANLANAVHALDAYGVKLTENQRWTLQALITQGRYNEAMDLFNKYIEPATKSAEKYGKATQKHAADAAAADLAQRHLAGSTKESGDEAETAAGKFDRFGESVRGVPEEATVKVKADIAAAMAAIDAWIRKLYTIPGLVTTRVMPSFSTPQQLGPSEHGSYIPGAASGGFVRSDQLLRVGEHSKPEMILPLQDPRGIAALTKALERAGADRGGNGRLHVISGRVDLNTGAMRIIAREEEEDARVHHRNLERMTP